MTDEELDREKERDAEIEDTEISSLFVIIQKNEVKKPRHHLIDEELDREKEERTKRMPASTL